MARERAGAADTVTPAPSTVSGADIGVSALVVTEIGRDGTLAGPDLDQLGAVLSATEIPLIASGGVGGPEDLISLARLRTPDGRRLSGAIAGRAIYEGRLTVREGIAACGDGGFGND